MVNFLLSSATSFFLVFFLPFKFVLYLFIVLGHAHFLIAYIYSHKAGKINNIYIYKFLTLIGFFGFVCFFIFIKKDIFLFHLLLFITLLFFIYHYFNDEFKISNLFTFGVKKFGTYSVMMAFIALLLVNLFNISNNNLFIYFLLLLCTIYSFIFSYFFFKKEKIQINMLLFYLFFLLNISVPFYLIFIKMVSIYQIAGFVILFHYFRWYLRYLDIFKGEVLKEYISFVFWSNLFVTSLFIWYITSFKSGVSIFIFSPVFFYGWTMIHIIMSLRKEDLLF